MAGCRLRTRGNRAGSVDSSIASRSMALSASSSRSRTLRADASQRSSRGVCLSANSSAVAPNNSPAAPGRKTAPTEHKGADNSRIIKPRSDTADDRTADRLHPRVVLRAKDSQGAIGQPEYEMHHATRQHVLACRLPIQLSDRVVADPNQGDESPQRGYWKSFDWHSAFHLRRPTSGLRLRCNPRFK
jgi:hypothetical protein